MVLRTFLSSAFLLVASGFASGQIVPPTGGGSGFPTGHSVAISKDWPQPHDMPHSETYPPNHFGASSTTWPNPHATAVSEGYPPSHFQNRSENWPNPHSSAVSEIFEDNVRKNNYFDGPFDQVPPNLSIKNILEEIYPYVKDRGGIDDHGNFKALHHSRVAISPYVKYSNTSEFLTFASQVLRPHSQPKTISLAFLDLVYESKMDFHLTVRGAQVTETDLEPKTEAPSAVIERNSK